MIFGGSSITMVNLPEGKMKSREGTVVDADDLVSQLSALAGEEIAEKGREEEVGDVKGTSAAIALGALNYYLLEVTPERDMVFNPKESISFNGNTGPYLQYMALWPPDCFARRGILSRCALRFAGIPLVRCRWDVLV